MDECKDNRKIEKRGIPWRECMNGIFLKESQMQYKLSKSEWLKIGEQAGWLKEAKCWKGYKAVGMKKKKGKIVPNCVRKES